MIIIDNRTGSGELYPYFPQGMAKLSRLEYADLFWLGRGPEDAPISVGMERKRIMDLVNCLTSGRLSGHQLPGLTNCYDVTYLVVEGWWRASPNTAVLETYQGGKWVSLSLGARTFMAREIFNYLNSLIILGGVIPWFSHGPKETVTLACSLYHWWNDKDFYSHKSHKMPYKPFASLKFDAEPPLVFRMAVEIPGLGSKRALNASKVFKSPWEMVTAEEKEWRAVEGVGKVLSKKVTKLLRGEKAGG